MIYLDRIEGEFAVIYEDGKKRDVPAGDIEGDFREGDVLVYSGGKYRADKEQTARRRAEIIKKENSLWE